MEVTLIIISIILAFGLVIGLAQMSNLIDVLKQISRGVNTKK